MSKRVLDWEDEEDLFMLIGISCHQKDYRLCWELNKTLGLELQKEDDIPGGEKEISFSRYYFNNEDFLQEFYLLSNKAGKNFLAPEMKQADYILQVYGLRNENEGDELVQQISGIDSVLTAFTFDAAKLKQGHALFYTATTKKKKKDEDLLAAFRINKTT